MHPRSFVSYFLALTLTFCGTRLLVAQDIPAGQGPRGGGMFWSLGRGTIGTVTAVAPDRYTIKTELGETYTIFFSANTRILKQPPGQPGGRRRDAGDGEPGAMRTPPQPIKSSEIKAGDVISAGGDVDTNAHTVGAIFIALMDPERAKEMRAMEANYGKTWLMGRVGAISEVKVTLESGPTRGQQTFVADENTTFRKRRDPITLGDIQVGDLVRVEGAVKDGVFIAASVTDIGTPQRREGASEDLGKGPFPGPPQ